MLRSFGFRLSLWSAQSVPQPWPWQRQLCSQVLAGVGSTKANGVDHKDDGPLHVSVSEEELLNIAQSKECSLPGVNFEPKNRRWRAYWYEDQTRKFAYYGIGKLEKKGMTENSASLAALRAAITVRNEKVVANVSEKLHFDEEELLAMVETKKCPIPGVNFRETHNSWEVSWYEQKKQKTCYFPLKKFEAHSTTEKEGILDCSPHRHRLPSAPGWLEVSAWHEDDQDHRRRRLNRRQANRKHLKTSRISVVGSIEKTTPDMSMLLEWVLRLRVHVFVLECHCMQCQTGLGHISALCCFRHRGSTPCSELGHHLLCSWTWPFSFRVRLPWPVPVVGVSSCVLVRLGSSFVTCLGAPF